MDGASAAVATIFDGCRLAWHGHAAKTDVWLQVFCDDAKAAKLWLINHGQRYDVGTTNGFKGESVDVLSLSVPCTDLNEDIGIHLVVYDLDDLKGALRPDSQPKPRGDEAAVAHLVAASAHELPPASSNVQFPYVLFCET